MTVNLTTRPGAGVWSDKKEEIVATNVVMPQMGYDMREGTVVRWHKREGEAVNRGEVIADIETDKATVEFEAYTDGVLGRIVAGEGIAVPVGDLIAIITAPGEVVPVPADDGEVGDDGAVADVDGGDVAPAPEVAVAAVAPSVAVAAVVAPPIASDGSADGGRMRASPIARRLARERGIDLALLAGSGPNGRIVEQDVLNYEPPAEPEPEPEPVVVPEPTVVLEIAESEPEPAVETEPELEPEEPAAESDLVLVSEPDPFVAPAPVADVVADLTPEVAIVPDAPAEGRIELSRMRQTIARVTSDSKAAAPHFYVTAEIDMGKAMALRRDINDAADPANRVSVNDLMVKACALALGKHPKFNSFYRGDYLELHGAMNIGIAIALDTGLILPGVSNCEGKSLLEIAAATKDLIARANSGTLRNEEYSSTTFSISNMGMFDVESFTAIIYPPHAAILAVGSVKEQPVVRDGQLGIGQVVKATLSTDHRVADGAEAAQFLMEIKRALESPVSLLL